MAESAVDTKAARHELIADLISSMVITSQEQLRRLLAQKGFETAQATLSRDLGELRALKVRTSGGMSVYSIPDVNGRHQPLALEGSARLAKWCQDLLVSAQQAMNQVVLRTPAGAANLLGTAIDSSRLEGVLGSIAGDDTILVICDSTERATQVRALLVDLAERGA